MKLTAPPFVSVWLSVSLLILLATGGCYPDPDDLRGESGGGGRPGTGGSKTGGGGVGRGGLGGGSGSAGTSGGGKMLARFIGIWHPISGTTTTVCDGTQNTDTITDNLPWSAGVSSDLTQTVPGSSCVLNANVTGDTASAAPSQSCTQVSGAITYVINFTQYTFSLGADGQTATENGSGTATGNETGFSITCSYSESASYQKISN